MLRACRHASCTLITHFREERLVMVVDVSVVAILFDLAVLFRRGRYGYGPSANVAVDQ